jgi:hypothetical protein
MIRNTGAMWAMGEAGLLREFAPNHLVRYSEGWITVDSKPLSEWATQRLCVGSRTAMSGVPAQWW